MAFEDASDQVFIAFFSGTFGAFQDPYRLDLAQSCGQGECFPTTHHNFAHLEQLLHSSSEGNALDGIKVHASRKSLDGQALAFVIRKNLANFRPNVGHVWLKHIGWIAHGGSFFHIRSFNQVIRIVRKFFGFIKISHVRLRLPAKIFRGRTRTRVVDFRKSTTLQIVSEKGGKRPV